MLAACYLTTVYTAWVGMYHWYLGGLPGLSRRRTGLQIGKTSGYGPGFVDMGMGITYWTKYGVGARVFNTNLYRALPVLNIYLVK